MTLRLVLARLFRRNRVREQLARDRLFQAVVEQSPDVICRAWDGQVTYISPSAERIFGWTEEVLAGSPGLELVHEDDRPAIEHGIAEAAAGRQTESIDQVRLICGDGSLKWAEITARAALKDGKADTIFVIRDITDRKRLEEELMALALQDGLTGLANRRSFDQTLDREWKRTLREGSQMALLLLDIDHFKSFNDSYGHQAGDDCIRAVAACVDGHARRPSDLACRYGGEEIAVILGGTGMEKAMEIAETIRLAIVALAIPHAASACSDHLTVSIGVAAAIARVGGTMRMPEGLLQAADHALYKAKAGGRDRAERAVLIAPSD